MGRTVAELTARLQQVQVFGGQHVVPTSIAYDSRRVTPGALFVCWKGQNHDGHAFAPEAVRHGAAAILCERRLDILRDVPQIVVPNSRQAMGQVAAAFFGNPSNKLRLIGVTGTNGKTTTTYLIKALLDATGHSAGLIGTISHRIGDHEVVSTRTTPEAPDIQALLADMVQHGCEACAMEVSSHGIALHRVEGCSFSAGLFTNLTQDHLDYHRTFEAYRDAKVELFRMVSDAAVINVDDPHADHFIRASSAPIVTYGLGSRAAFRAESVRMDAGGVVYVARTPFGSIDVQLTLRGLFNVYNSLGALALGRHIGIDLEDIVAALADVQVPGRFESVSRGQSFAVIVDYAHTPDGLENVLRTARAATKGKVIAVFGAGGNRDPLKRPLMGSIAAHHADYVIITSDNPRNEDPADICSQIEAGVRSAGMTSHQYAVITNRRDAIQQAISLAQPGDLVLIAGKGHETYQETNGMRTHFDDREEAVLAIEERYGIAKAQIH